MKWFEQEDWDAGVSAKVGLEFGRPRPERRGLTVLKMRGSKHDKDIREFMIDGDGMHIGRPFRGVVGILSGHPTHVSSSEIDRIGGLFAPGSGTER